MLAKFKPVVTRAVAGLLASILGLACAATPKPSKPTIAEKPVETSPTSPTSPSQMTPVMLTKRMPANGFDEDDENAAAIVDLLSKLRLPAGCESDSSPDVTGISFHEDGRVAHAGIEWIVSDCALSDGIERNLGILLQRGEQGWSIVRSGEEM